MARTGSAVVKKTIKNMLGGVSQQPPLQRLESQCEEMINCVPSLTEFLKRRNGVHFINSLAGNENAKENIFIDFIERGDNEAGLVTVDETGLVTVYNLNGIKIGSATNNYLASDNPKDDIKLCTVRDYNFLLNTKKKVKKSLGGWYPNISKYLVFIKQAAYDQQYTINIGGKEFTYTTPATDSGGTYKLSVETIAKELTKLITNQDVNTEYRNAYRCRGQGGEMATDPSGSAPYSPRSPHIVYGNLNLEGTPCLTEMRASISSDGGVSNYEMTCRHRLEHIGYYWESDKQIHEDKPEAAVSIRNVYTDKGIIIIETTETVTTYDGYTNNFLTSFKNKCYSFSELPVNAPQGWRMQVVGDTTSNADDYYIIFETEDGLSEGTIGKGGWKEVEKLAHDSGIYELTMPQVLKVNEEDITVEAAVWDRRQAGDNNSNPAPSFVGKCIKDIFFYKNRLGFITDDNIILSEAGEYFNFFQTTMVALLDSDPIDVAISGTKVSALKYVVPYAEGLFIYTDRSLYVLEYGEVLSTANVELKPVLQFDTSLSTEPVVCDTSIYYVGKKGSYNQVREYKPTDQTDQYGYSNDITSHIPKYISGDISRMIVSLEEGIMFLINRTNTIFCYSFIKDNGELLLSSWHKWTFTHPVLMGCLFGGWLYLVFQKDDNSLYLGKVAVSDVDTLFYDETGIKSDYISSYTYSPYYLRDSQGKVQDIPTMIRTMALKYSSGSEFKVVIDRKARKQEVRYTDKRRDFTRFLVASENKDVKIKIESVEDKPFNIIETDLEVVYASRS